MTQTFEEANSRLDNIQSIEPLLSALRTMSMGAWQMALIKIAGVQKYEENFNQIISQILPYIRDQNARKAKQSIYPPKLTDSIVLIIGTERGLCGRFNKSLIENALSWIDSRDFPSYQIWGMGTRLIRELEQLNINISWRNTLPASTLTTYQQSYNTTQKWLEQYESYAFNHFYILYSELAGGNTQKFSYFELLPFEIQHPANTMKDIESLWPPPIIETDPKGIYNQIIQHHIASSYYQILLKSSAAEHSSRYHQMQEAIDNAHDIIEELNRAINAERKRKITQEMQELAAGAGLLEN